MIRHSSQPIITLVDLTLIVGIVFILAFAFWSPI